jgi:hypothetical protein
MYLGAYATTNSATSAALSGRSALAHSGTRTTLRTSFPPAMLTVVMLFQHRPDLLLTYTTGVVLTEEIVRIAMHTIFPSLCAATAAALPTAGVAFTTVHEGTCRWSSWEEAFSQRIS